MYEIISQCRTNDSNEINGTNDNSENNDTNARNGISETNGNSENNEINGINELNVMSFCNLVKMHLLYIHISSAPPLDVLPGRQNAFRYSSEDDVCEARRPPPF
jgi:hypothetical protein